MMNRFTVLAVVGFLVVATPVWAEVMDKEPTATANWMWAVVGGALAIMAWRWHWWAGATVSTLALTGIFVMYQEINHPFIGPDIRAEAGQGYVIQYYWSAAVGCALHIFAAYNGLTAKRRAV